MAPLPENNTGVVFLDYSVGGEGHTAQMRYAEASGPVTVMDTLHEWLTAIGDGIFTITIEGARHRLVNAIVTFPITWSGDATYGSGAAVHSDSAQYYDFVGRSEGGRRVRLSVFGSKLVTDVADNDYRLPATGALGAAITALEGGGTGIVGIDGEPIIWYPYVNTGVNAYWRNKIR